MADMRPDNFICMRHTSAYASIRHTSAYVIRQHTSACLPEKSAAQLSHYSYFVLGSKYFCTRTQVLLYLLVAELDAVEVKD